MKLGITREGIFFSQVKKSIFLIQMSHIQLNDVFLVFWSNFADIDKKNISLRTKIRFFSSKCATYSETKPFRCFEAFLQKLKKNSYFG